MLKILGLFGGETGWVFLIFSIDGRMGIVFLDCKFWRKKSVGDLIPFCKVLISFRLKWIVIGVIFVRGFNEDHRMSILVLSIDSNPWYPVEKFITHEINKPF
jgi:hypothetical protein